eukprot:9901687-Karenia_brevis.AAC.1
MISGLARVGFSAETLLTQFSNLIPYFDTTNLGLVGVRSKMVNGGVHYNSCGQNYNTWPSY